MPYKKTIIILALTITIFSILSTAAALTTSLKSNTFEYESIREKVITIHGDGVYRHMSHEVAIQGLAQDYITLFLGVPVLLLSLLFALKGSLIARIILAGTSAYFFVTYTMYLCMATYSELFLVYAALVSASFFAILLLLTPLTRINLKPFFLSCRLNRLSAWFLMINSLIIALMWLSSLIPPLLDGSLYPPQLEHYTTLIVQGLDLALFLPLGFISGWLLYKEKSLGYLAAPLYIVFLTLLMNALSAKIIAMAVAGYNVIPAIIIIPLINIAAYFCLYFMLKDISKIKI